VSLAFFCPDKVVLGGVSEGTVMKDKIQMQHAAGARTRRGDDGLGPNSDIGMKLRALYGAVQDETIPDKFLELLEKLDQVEQQSKTDARQE
jgi:hypothetical protein